MKKRVRIRQPGIFSVFFGLLDKKTAVLLSNAWGVIVEFWRELAIAFCLMLVLEGVLPFLYPQRWRKLVAQLAVIDDRTLRWIGLASMLAGTGALYLIH